MTTTYKGFLIHSNLRCYYDNRGILEPVFVHTEFATIEQAKTRIDKYHEDAAQWESRRQINLAKSFEILKADMDLHDEAQQLDADKWNERIEAYEERQLFNHE